MMFCACVIDLCIQYCCTFWQARQRKGNWVLCLVIWCCCHHACISCQNCITASKTRYHIKTIVRYIVTVSIWEDHSHLCVLLLKLLVHIW